MRFGENEISKAMKKANNNYERGIIMLGEKKPLIGNDTRKDENGRCFVFNMEVTADEYSKFMDQYDLIMDREIMEGKEDLRKAA